MRFGHYTVFDTPEENKHTQVYVEYDVPNKDNLDGSTGTMILSDGSSESSGGGGDSRFSTCEVEVFFTKDGQPLALDEGGMQVFNKYTASAIPVGGDEMSTNWYTSFAGASPDHNIIKPLLFEGRAYIFDITGRIGNDYYTASYPPVVTGDISLDTVGETQVVVINGNGTITFEMVMDD